MIYDGTKQGIGFLPKLTILWPMGKMIAPTNFSEIDEAYLRASVRDLPEGRCCLDLEGGYALPGQEKWHFDESRDTAIQLRVDALRICQDERPDIDFGVYSVPWRVSEDMVEREKACVPISAQADDLYITAYPKPDQTNDDWEYRLRTKVAAAHWIHRARPYVLITHDTGKASISAVEFYRRLKVINSMGLDAVYWISAKAESIPKLIQLCLWWMR
jgi:hypothetical protein